MPLYVIIGHDVANSAAQRQQSRPAHVKRLQQLQTQGRLVIAGPTPIEHVHKDMAQSQSIQSPQATDAPQAMSGSLIIADFDNLAAVQAWVNEEPYLKDGVYSHVDIRPFIKTLPTAEN